MGPVYFRVGMVCFFFGVSNLAGQANRFLPGRSIPSSPPPPPPTGYAAAGPAHRPESYESAATRRSCRRCTGTRLTPRAVPGSPVRNAGRDDRLEPAAPPGFGRVVLAAADGVRPMMNRCTASRAATMTGNAKNRIRAVGNNHPAKSGKIGRGRGVTAPVAETWEGRLISLEDFPGRIPGQTGGLDEVGSTVFFSTRTA